MYIVKSVGNTMKCGSQGGYHIYIYIHLDLYNVCENRQLG